MKRHALARRPLTAALLLALATPLVAAPANEEDQHDRAKRLDALTVTATPIKQSAEELVRPIEVLAGARLDERKASSLGETLSGLPGVQSNYFGPGAGRPVIRGLDGARVQILSGGLSSLDVSTVSADHAASVEPFLADQIEVLKGPATLLYGSGAIGGAVNVVDGRIPERVPTSESGLEGRAELRHNTVNDERTGMFRLDGGGGEFAFHVDALRRKTGDVEIPGFPESAALLAEEGEEPDADEFGILPNSAVETKSGAIGASWVGSRGFIGAAVSLYDTFYGIPGHAHAHHEDEEDGHEEEGEEGDVRVDLRQRRFELKGSLLQPFAGHDSLSFRVANNDYEHVELEGDEVGTVFENDGIEARLEMVHRPLAGWIGAYGVQYGRRDFAAFGEEAFVPASLTRDIGVFLIEEKDWGRVKLELGARLDSVEVDPVGADRAEFDTASFSLGARWRITNDFHLQLGLDHAERAPTAEELFSDGPHVATRGFEIGDADLREEAANRAELGLHWHVGRVDLKLAAYHTRFDDFIYLAETGEEEDELPVRQWTQADARFNGFEAEATVRLAENAAGVWDLRLFGDAVNARLEDGGNLPRIPAARGGTELRWNLDGWRASVGAVRYASQDDVAEFERSSGSYTLVNAHLAYHWDVNGTGWEVFLDGSNLTDREARLHTSFLKDLAPLPGRALAFGIRAFF